MRVVWLLHAASSQKKLNSIDNVDKVAQEQGPFSKLRIILVETSKESVTGNLGAKPLQ
jgi:hypothetical protein